MISIKYREGMLRERLQRLEAGDFSQVMQAGGQEIVRDVIGKIGAQTRSDERGSLERNARSTLDRKARKGTGDKSLVDGGKRLLSSGSYAVTAGKQSVKVELTERPEKGYWWHNTKYMWWGISETARRAVTRLFTDSIRKALK
jgi:hypothetical protein